MRRLSGQAARDVAHALHWLATVGLALLVLLLLGAAALSWRLAQGPLELPWLAARLQASLAPELAPQRLTIGSAALAWEGFSHGLGSPVDIRLMGVSLSTTWRSTPDMLIPSARITLALPSLLRGRIAPRAVELDRPQIEIRRTADGPFSPTAETPGTGQPPIAAILNELSRPTGRRSGGIPVLRDLTRLSIRDADLTIRDHQTATTWHAPLADLDLRRAPRGGVVASAHLTLALGPQSVPLSATAILPPGSQSAAAELRLGPLRPADLAEAAPILRPLAAIRAPLSGEATLTVGPGLALSALHISLHAGPGSARFAGSTLPIDAAALTLTGAPDDLAISSLLLRVPGPAGAPATTIQGSGSLQRDAARSSISLALDLDHLRFSDLAALWPAGIAADPRAWITENITGGVAHDGHLELTLSVPPSFDTVRITGASGRLSGDGLTVHWLRPIPPVTGAQAELRVLGPDSIDIAVSAARQAPEAPGGEGLAIPAAHIRISGLTGPVQDAAIEVDLDGTVPNTLALLRDKRLGLLSRHKVKLNDPAGQVSGSVDVALPLLADVNMDQVRVSARLRLSSLRLADVIAGQALTDGTFNLTAGNDGLAFEGQGKLADIPARIGGSMDFRMGPPSQAVQTVMVTGRPTATQLAAAGLDSNGVVSGPVQLAATLTERRNGAGSVAVRADLTEATLTVPPLAWRKPPGQPAKASFELALDHDRLMRIDPFRVEGDNLLLEGRAAFAGGRLASVRADRITLGRTRAQALVRFAPPGGAITATISGSSLDLSGRFPPRRQRGPAPRPHRPTPRGPAWQADLRFDRVILAHGIAVGGFAAHAVDNGGALSDLRLEAFTGRAEPVLVVIAPAAQGRTLRISATDTGELLRALDLVDTMDGGKLTLTAHYDDRQESHPLSGTLELDDFRLRNAPLLGKLLQAITLYGLPDALQGPGLSFSKLVAPFRLDDGLLEITEARAFSPSLGLTAKGSLDLDAARIDLQGTIIPVYFFNSLLGRMPVIGRLFSAEQGGGLIAGSYTMKGALDDPAVAVNPLTALTPGFLRGLLDGL